ncbi:MAG: hypothetical protein HY401_03465 [Elusimicrobia bacterium]|nr:hypothetical protein [Elusimicrobiota bacterium]
MKIFKLNQMIKGWFVGDFEPNCLRLDTCEVACKYYNAGDEESRHVHKVAVEITLVAKGKIIMNGQSYREGDIILLEPGEPADFKVVEDAITMVVKSPSVPNDKYLV